MFTPKISGLSILVPKNPPVKKSLLKTINSRVVPSPRVTTARVIPRVLTAGRAKRMPTGMVSSTPQISAIRKGTCQIDTMRPATHAPKPAMANCASDICPA